MKISISALAVPIIGTPLVTVTSAVDAINVLNLFLVVTMLFQLLAKHIIQLLHQVSDQLQVSL